MKHPLFIDLLLLKHFLNFHFDLLSFLLDPYFIIRVILGCQYLIIVILEFSIQFQNCFLMPLGYMFKNSLPQPLIISLILNHIVTIFYKIIALDSPPFVLEEGSILNFSF